MNPQRPIESGPDQRLLINNEPNREDPDQSEPEDATFKPKIFAEFTSYFLIAQWLGPLSYFLFVTFIRNGRLIMRNLHIFGGWKEILRLMLWVAKIYCFIVTFTLGVEYSPVEGGNTYESRSQFWLVIYTDIALAVLHGGYYSSFTDSEIKKFKTEICHPEDNIVDEIVQLIRIEKTRAFERRFIVSRYPEIDVNNFFFVYPQKYAHMIPERLQPRPVSEAASYLQRIMITNGLLVDGDKYADYLTDKGGYQQLSKNVLAIKIISRILVFIRVTLPVAQNIEKMLENNQSYNEGSLLLYIIQQVFYCYFISKFAEIYDVLFLGLLLYYRRLKLLRVLKQLIDVRPQKSPNELLKIVPTVPQNIENWLTLRKIFSGMNQQAFVVIDINTSFTLLYTLLFIGFYALYSLNLISDLLQPMADFLTQNSIFQAAIFFTVVIVVFVLLIHLALGIMINLLFRTERKEWTLQSEIMRSIRISHNVYHDSKMKKSVDELLDGDEYMERVENVQNVMGSFFKSNFEDYIKKLRDAVLLVLDGLNYEEAINPHTLLGIKTTPRLAISVVTLVSAVGLSTINDFINQATGKE